MTTAVVKTMLDHYAGETPAVLKNLSRILMHGKLGGTGRMVILPVDQGFEHGPARSFAVNPAAYNPDYFVKLAINAGLSAYAAPYGQLAAMSKEYRNQIPLIMKINSASSLLEAKDNAVTATVDDAARLGCAAIGYTVYPGSEHYYHQVEKLTILMSEARKQGIATVLWSYPRGGTISKDGETALDIIAYAAHMAAQCGAHIVKVKLPTDFLEQPEAKKVYEEQNIQRAAMADRVKHVVECCFKGRRPVVFSGGATKGEEGVLDDARAIMAGGGNGSIIGRNAFQRSEADALELLAQLVRIYQG